MWGIKKMYFLFIYLFIVSSSLGSITKSIKNVRDTVVSAATNSYNTVTGVASFIAKDIYLAMRKEFKDSTPVNHEEYDFIIVGAGSAGCVMARKLSDIGNTTVLLIEAGPKEHLLYDIPFIASYNQLLYKSIVYDYRTEYTGDVCLGMANKQCAWRRGKVMGGSSVMNYVIATHGNRRDYDNWASMGNEGWSFNDMIKYIKKLENSHAEPMEKQYHGFDGPLPVSQAPSRTKLSYAFMEGANALGYSEIDYDGKEQMGFSFTHETMRNGERWSSNRAFLHPIHGRRNLFVTRNSQAGKILIDSNSKKAYGVLFTKKGRTIEVRAKKEVIVCGGSIETPKLLMLSGIGPLNHLREFGIDVKLDAPGVGENLADHLAYWGFTFDLNDTVSVNPIHLLSPTDSALGDYFKKRQGPLTIPTGEVTGFFDVDNPQAKEGLPNIELIMGPISAGSELLIRKLLNFDINHYNAQYLNRLNKPNFIIVVILQHPKSKGKVLLRSTDPKAYPKIYANYLKDPDDVRVLTKGMRMAVEITQTQQMQKYGATLSKNPILGCEHLERFTDAYWECALRTFGTTLWHPTSTCKMGPKNDTMAVVDQRLKVYGIDKLRIVDASIMPSMITGHLNMPIMTIALKAADMIKEDWGYPIN